jgi:hypothetical protein
MQMKFGEDFFHGFDDMMLVSTEGQDTFDTINGEQQHGLQQLSHFQVTTEISVKGTNANSLD